MNRKRLLVLCATGETGQQIVSQALDQGHDVTALVRNPRKLTVAHERLRVVTGSVTDEGLLVESVRGRDAIISALGMGRSLKSGGLIARTTKVIVPAMESADVRRLIFISAYGVAESRADVPFLPRLLISLLLRDIYADKAAGEAELRRSRLHWTLVRPTTLTNSPITGHYRAGEHLALRGLPTVSRADVAHFILTEVDDTTYLKKGVLVSH
jgi:putative NADH-flavin reductase